MLLTTGGALVSARFLVILVLPGRHSNSCGLSQPDFKTGFAET
jgi:hypothetical protein